MSFRISLILQDCHCRDMDLNYMGQIMRKCALCNMQTGKGAGELAHPRSLISALFVRRLDSTISLRVTANISSL